MTQTPHGFPGSGDSQWSHSHPPFPAPFLIMTGSASVGSGVSFQMGPGVCGWIFFFFLTQRPVPFFFQHLPSSIFNIYPPQLAFLIPSNSPSLKDAGHICQPQVKARWGSSWGICHHHSALQGSLTLRASSPLHRHPWLASSGEELAAAEV